MFRAGWIQKLLRRTGQQKETDSGRDWQREAEELKKKKNWIALVKHCQNWVRAEPTDWFGWNSLGHAQIFVKQYSSAIAAYRQSLNLNPTAATWAGLSNAHHLLKQFDHAVEALRSMEDVMRTDPDDALANDVTAWVGLALSYHALNQRERMKDAFQEAELLTSTYPQEEADNWFTIALAYRNIGDSDEVQKVYQRLRDLDPDTAERLRDAALN